MRETAESSGRPNVEDRGGCCGTCPGVAACMAILVAFSACRSSASLRNLLCASLPLLRFSVWENALGILLSQNTVSITLTHPFKESSKSNFWRRHIKLWWVRFSADRALGLRPSYVPWQTQCYSHTGPDDGFSDICRHQLWGFGESP